MCAVAVGMCSWYPLASYAAPAAVANVLNQYRANPQQLPPRDVLERQVLESLIMLRL